MKKYFSYLFAIIWLGIPMYFLLTHQQEEIHIISQMTIFILLPLFVFNFIARNYLVFKPYFTSKFNLLTSYQKESFQYDLSKDLMFAKLIEAVKLSDLKLKDTNEATGQILATSSMSLVSSGENIYIHVQQKGTFTEVTLEMTTIAQINSWGKNRANYRNILSQFEESLTI